MKNTSTITAAAVFCVTAGLALVFGDQPTAPSNLRFKPPPPPPPCSVPEPAGGGHAYYDALVRLPEHSCNWSLRDQAQLNSLAADSLSQYFTYSFPNDSHPHAQDAAKLVVNKREDSESASIPGKQQLLMPVKLTAGSVLLTWDWYWAPEFRTNYGEVTDYKAFQLMIDGHAWWTLMWNLRTGIENVGAGNDKAVATLSDEFRSGADEALIADAMTSIEVVEPTGAGALRQKQFVAEYGTWTRYWLEVRMFEPAAAFTEWATAHNGGKPIRPNDADTGVRKGWVDSGGKWHMVSLWIADEKRGPVRLLYQVPFNFRPDRGWTGDVSLFRFEMNSSKTGFEGPFVGYGRNVVVLHDYKLPIVPESDKLIFQRPQR